MSNLVISSPAFKNNKEIPRKYTCNGEDVNPQLDIKALPEETKKPYTATSISPKHHPTTKFDTYNPKRNQLHFTNYIKNLR